MNIKLLTLAIVIGTSAVCIQAQEKTDPKIAADAKKLEAEQKAEAAKKAAEISAKMKEFFAAGDAAAKEKKYDLMLEEYKKALSISPESERFNTLMRIGNSVEKADKNNVKKMSLDYFRDAVKIAANADQQTNAMLSLAIKGRQFNEAESLNTLKSIQAIPKATNKNNVAATLAMADYEEDIDAFEKKCREALGIAGSDSNLISQVYFKMIDKHTNAYGTRDYKRAEALAKEAIENKSLQPAQRAGLLFKLSEIYNLLDDEKMAFAALNDVLKIETLQDNYLQDAYLKLASRTLNKDKYMTIPSADDYKAAIGYYEKILPLKKVNFNAANLGIAKSYLGLNDYQKAGEAAQKVIDNPSKNNNEISEAYCILGDIAVEKAEYRQAFDAYKQANELKKDILVLEKQARGAFAAKDYDSALETLEEMKKMDVPRYVNNKCIDRWIENAKKQKNKGIKND